MLYARSESANQNILDPDQKLNEDEKGKKKKSTC